MSSYAAMSDSSSMSSDMEQHSSDFLDLNMNENSSIRSKDGYIPHQARPLHTVKKRNARERTRVETVNNAFSRLRQHIPYENRNKRLSKVKTLRKAMDYIRHLQHLLTDHDPCTHVEQPTIYANPAADVMTSHAHSPDVHSPDTVTFGRLQATHDNNYDWCTRSNDVQNVNVSPGSHGMISPVAPANQNTQNYLNNMMSQTAGYHVIECAVPHGTWHHGNQQVTSRHWDGCSWTL